MGDSESASIEANDAIWRWGEGLVRSMSSEVCPKAFGNDQEEGLRLETASIVDISRCCGNSEVNSLTLPLVRSAQRQRQRHAYGRLANLARLRRV